MSTKPPVPNFTAKTFPTNSKQILFNDVLNFYGYLRLHRLAVDFGESQLRYAQALSFLSDITEEQYLEYFPLNLEKDMPPGMSEEEQAEMMKELFTTYMIHLDDDLSMVRVEAHLHNVINSTASISFDKATQFSMRVRLKNEDGSYEDKIYKLNLDLWTDHQSGFDLPSGPAVEVMRFGEMYENGDDPFSESYDIKDHQNRAYGTLAYLLVDVEGEKFPMMKKEREAYVLKKQNRFLNSDMTYNDVQQVCFFLSKISSTTDLRKLLSPSGKVRGLKFNPKILGSSALLKRRQ